MKNEYNFENARKNSYVRNLKKQAKVKSNKCSKRQKTEDLIRNG